MEQGLFAAASEYENLIDYAIAIGVENGFIQEGPTASESFIPVFDGTGLPGEPVEQDTSRDGTLSDP